MNTLQVQISGICKKSKIGIVTSIAFFLFSNTLFAQFSPALQWQKCFGGSNHDWGYSIVQTTDGGYAIAGETYSNDNDVKGFHGQSDIWIIKIGSSGVIEWQKCLGGSGGQSVGNLIQTSDGGFAIAGATSSNDGDVSGNPNLNAGWIVKLNPSGNIEWQKCIEGVKNISSNEVNSIKQTSDGGYIIAGDGNLFQEGCSPIGAIADLNTHVFIVRLDASGSILWERCYGGNKMDFAKCIIDTYDNGYAFCGFTSSNNGDVSGHHSYPSGGDSLLSFDMWVVKLDSYGIIKWQKCLGGKWDDRGYSLVQASDSGFLIAGSTNSWDGDIAGHLHGDSVNRKYDMWVVKLNSSGIIQWQKLLGGSRDDAGRSIIRTIDGGYIIAGTASSIDGDLTGCHDGDSTMWVVKVNFTGKVEWQKCLGGSGGESTPAIIQTTDQGYALTGSTLSNDGEVTGNHGRNDVWVVKLGTYSTVSNSFFSDNVPYQIFKIYPNPSSENVNLQLSNSDQIIQQVQFFDVVGRQFIPGFAARANLATVHVNSLADGVYIARVTYNYNGNIRTHTLPLIVRH